MSIGRFGISLGAACALFACVAPTRDSEQATAPLTVEPGGIHLTDARSCYRGCYAQCAQDCNSHAPTTTGATQHNSTSCVTNCATTCQSDCASCTPSCANQPCGADDGCFGTCSAGVCPAGSTCGGGGVPNQCGSPIHTQLTAFLPSTNGFDFNNSKFPHAPLVTINYGAYQVPIGDANNGMCGGMVYSAFDYFVAGRSPPPLFNAPGSGPIFDYLVVRLIDSFNLPLGLTQYLSLMDPALPDHETDASQAGLAPHGRAWVTVHEQWPAIQQDLDSGSPSPLGLVLVKTTDPTMVGHNHQVLAWGYDLDTSNNLKIRVYDPNNPFDNWDRIELNIGDPLHTTAMSLISGSGHTTQVWAFFRTNYSSTSPPPPCGDGACDVSESCSSCASDCGPCVPPPPRCGDGICNGSETCSSCPSDCGACQPSPWCGDGVCNGSETCTSCPDDCGACSPPPPACGDGVCNGSETCASCASDCGSCCRAGYGHQCGDGCWPTGTPCP